MGTTEREHKSIQIERKASILLKPPLTNLDCSWVNIQGKWANKGEFAKSKRTQQKSVERY